MKEVAIAFIVIVAALLFWNNRQSATYETAAGATVLPIQTDIVQVILEEVQRSLTDVVPIETLFVTRQGEDTYNSRFMFFNTSGFYGVQYDVQARVKQDGSVSIMSMTETARPDYSSAYVPDKYQSFDVIQANLDKQLKDALTSYNSTQKTDNK
jgi:hypothetical protein